MFNSFDNIPPKAERIQICTSHSCSNCPLLNIWCFDENIAPLPDSLLKPLNPKQLEFSFVDLRVSEGLNEE